MWVRWYFQMAGNIVKANCKSQVWQTCFGCKRQTTQKQQIREIKLVSIIFKSGPTTSQRKRVGGTLSSLVLAVFFLLFCSDVAVFTAFAFVCQAACAGQITF